MTGLWFWHDEVADPRLRSIYHGEIVGEPSPGYALLRFNPNVLLPKGTHELVSLARIEHERWALFESEDALREAMRGSVG